MQWSDLPLRPSRRMLRQFAGLWIVFFAGLAAWQYVGHERTSLALALGALAVTLGPLGLAAPGAIRPIFVAWLVVTFPIGWVVSRALIVTMFWAVIVPVGLTSRLAGRDVLLLERRRDRNSYWRPKARPSGVRSYFRQF